MMEVILFLFVVALVGVALLATRLTDSYAPYPYRAREDALCSQVEAQFLTLLEKSIGDDFRIFTKVRLNDIVAVRQNVSRSTIRSAQNKASQRVLDYVLCDRETMQVRAAIELEPANGNGEQAKRNWFLKNTLAAAGIPFLRFKAKPGYRIADMRDYIHGKIMQAEPVRAAVPRPAKTKAAITRPLGSQALATRRQVLNEDEIYGDALPAPSSAALPSRNPRRLPNNNEVAAA